MLKVTLRELINGKDEWVCNHIMFWEYNPFAELHIHKNQRPIRIATSDILKIETVEHQYKPL